MAEFMGVSIIPSYVHLDLQGICFAMIVCRI